MENKIKSVKTILPSVINVITNRRYFSVIYLTLSILWSLPMLCDFIDPIIKLAFIWGVGILVWDFFTKRIMFKSKYSIWLLLFSVAYLVTVFLNREQLYEGVKHFIYNSFFLFLVYPFNIKESRKKQIKSILLVTDIISVITFIASSISIIMFLCRFSYVLVRGETQYGQGVLFNRLYGVYTSANPGALLSACTVFLVFITFCLNKEHFKKFKLFYIINCIIQFVYYTLTLSNGGHLAWIVGMLAICVTIVLPILKKKRKTIIAWLLTVLVFGVSLIVFECVTHLSRSLMVSTATLINNHKQENFSSDFLSEDDVDTIVLERVEKDNNIANGRLTIWEGGLAALAQKPVFGWSNSKFYSEDTLLVSLDETRLSQLQIDELKRAGGYMHNAVVQILVCSGVLGLVLFAIFAVLVSCKYITALVKMKKDGNYFAVASVFSFLALLLSQIVAESHILFNRQDPFACLFWLFLGFGMYLIQHIKEDETKDRAFVCVTPLHVVSAVNLALSNKEEGGNDDIYIMHAFNGSREIAKNLNNEAVFRNIYEFEPIYKKGGKFGTLIRVLFPVYSLKKLALGNKDFYKQTYKTVLFGFYTAFCDTIYQINRNAQTMLFDEGIGSYTIYDIGLLCHSKFYKRAISLLFPGEMEFKPKALYLTSPEFALDLSLPVKKLECATDVSGGIEKLKRIIGFNQSDVYKKNKSVYITQPLNEKTCDGVSEAVALNLLSAIKPILRVHPRQSVDEFANFKIDTVRNMWELECAESITDKHVLWGAFSTAQLTPKMMFDREPTLVFLYKLYGCDFDNADEMVERIKSVYRDKSKVITVENLDELNALIKQLG